MPRNPHALFRENIPAYALGALDASDSAALAIHLKSCASCRDELMAYQALSDGLLMAIPPQSPSGCLAKKYKDKIAKRSKSFQWALDMVIRSVRAGNWFRGVIAVECIYPPPDAIVPTSTSPAIESTTIRTNCHGFVVLSGYTDASDHFTKCDRNCPA